MQIQIQDTASWYNAEHIQYDFLQTSLTFFSLSFSSVPLLLVDRPWLTESQQVQKLQEKVYLALQHSLHMRGAGQEKLDKVRDITSSDAFFFCLINML